MTTSKQIRWGILGTGWVAQRFAADLRDVRGAELVAMASRTETRAQVIAKRFGIRKTYGSYEALLTDPDVDVIYVASLPHEHARHCLEALRRGKHILCEKPFTVSVEQTNEIIQTARDENRFCMEAMWTRFLPGTVNALRQIESGAIGSPELLTADFGIPVSDSTSNRFADLADGGGALFDRGVYAISLAIWLFGKPLRVSARAHFMESGADRTVSVILEFVDSKSAVISASLSAYSGNEALVAGSNGRLRFHEPFYRPERVTISRAPLTGGGDLNPQWVKENLRALVSRAKSYLPVDIRRSRTLRSPVRGFGYGYEAQEVVRCLNEGLIESPVLPLHQSLTVMETLQSIRQQLSAR